MDDLLKAEQILFKKIFNLFNGDKGLVIELKVNINLGSCQGAYSVSYEKKRLNSVRVASLEEKEVRSLLLKRLYYWFKSWNKKK